MRESRRLKGLQKHEAHLYLLDILGELNIVDSRMGSLHVDNALEGYEFMGQESISKYYILSAENKA